MKQITLISMACLFAGIVHAQITTNEQPYGLQVRDTMWRQLSPIVLAAPDIIRLAVEDSIKDQEPCGGTRFAYPVWVNYTLENSGEWQQLNDGSKIWRLKVRIPDALSTHTYYDRFWLPNGCKFFVYSEETRQSIGAITSDFIAGSKGKPIKFASALIYGESVIYEYYQPASVVDTAIISISRIDYGYRYVNNPYQNGNRGALSCNLEICNTLDYQNERRAVTKIIVPPNSGSEWYSGALMNNTNNDNTPYVLTSAEPLFRGGLLNAVGNADASQWQFYWDYSSSCGTSDISTTGATIVANGASNQYCYYHLGFALLHLQQDPRCISSFTPYYLGWDITGIAASSSSCIHHPKGDFKKYTLFNGMNSNTISYSYGQICYFPVGALWNMDVTYNNGTVEQGSLGAPLLDDNNRVIGTFIILSYLSSCPTPSFSFIANFGKFSVAWTGDGAMDPRNRLMDWLDPNNTGATTCDGINGAIPNSSSILHVTVNGSGNKTGSDWNNAIDGFAKALKIANMPCLSTPVTEIWVGDGTYYPTPGTNRFVSFELPPNVKCYGGFPSNGGLMSERDPIGGRTILSGAITNTPANNTNTVVIAGEDTHLDGFSIRDGYANGGGDNDYGGGIRVTGQTELRRLYIHNNYGVKGGGMAFTNLYWYAYSQIENIESSDNESFMGGGIYCTPFFWSRNSSQISMPEYQTLDSSEIYRDSMPIYMPCVDIRNILLARNNATYGSALYVEPGGLCALINATISDNEDEESNVQGVMGQTNLSNSILWNNTTSTPPNLSGISCRYSLIQNVTTSGTSYYNLDGSIDPYFVNPSIGNYQLSFYSLCRDKGETSFNNTATDLAGNPRVVGNAIDLGAYECQRAQLIPNSSGVLFIKKGGSGLKNGSNWANAASELSDGLENASINPAIEEIWVSDATYYPTTTGDRSASFYLPSGVKIYGGFPANANDITHTSINNRYLNKYSLQTILSGDIGVSGNASDNSYHVVVADENSLLDGCKITGGNANGSGENNYNGTQVSQGKGGGIYVMGNAEFYQLEIVKNNGSEGGGIYQNNGACSSLFINSFIANNTANSGGAAYIATGNCDMLNATIVDNVNSNNSMQGIVNNGILNSKNSILFNNSTTGSISNTTFSHSLVQGITPSGVGNLAGTTDPLFVNPSMGDYRLQYSSPCRNAGNNSYILSGIQTDLSGNPRIVSGTVDMGVYEHQGIKPNSSGILFVKQNGAGLQDGSDWENALCEFSDALSATTINPIYEIWVSDGTYYPTTTGDRDVSFVLPGNVRIYGGFPSNATTGTHNTTNSRYIRNGHGHPYGLGTILSGNIGGSGNSYHVVIAAVNSYLDGFKITGGNADGSGNNDYNGIQVPRNKGGGIYVTDHAELVRLEIEGNEAVYGGGIAAIGGCPHMENIYAHSNSASSGGGIYCEYTNLYAKYFHVFENLATNSGGGICCYDNHNDDQVASIFENVCIHNNNAGLGSGGGIYNRRTVSLFINALLYNNWAATGATVFNEDLPARIIFVYATMNKTLALQHPEIEEGASFHSYYSLIALDGNGGQYSHLGLNGVNLIANALTNPPLFQDPYNGNFTLNTPLPLLVPFNPIIALIQSIAASIHFQPCNYDEPSLITRDIVDNNRPIPTTTYGAYEFPNNTPGNYLYPWPPNVFTWKSANTNESQEETEAFLSKEVFDWDLKIYSNPVASGEQIMVSLSNGYFPYNNPVHLKLFSITGVQLFSQTHSVGEFIMEIPPIAPGVYMIRLQTEEGAIYTGKLVVK